MYVDLFAGCGGLSYGLYNAGWQGLFAVEKNKDAFATLKYNLIDSRDHFNWPTWLEKDCIDINDLIVEHRQELEKLRGTVELKRGHNVAEYKKCNHGYFFCLKYDDNYEVSWRKCCR